MNRVFLGLFLLAMSILVSGCAMNRSGLRACPDDVPHERHATGIESQTGIH